MHRLSATILALTLLVTASPASASWSNISYLWDSLVTTTRFIGFTPILIGRELNGTALDGEALDGHRVVGVDLATVEFAGETTPWVWLHESRFSLIGKKSGWKGGKALVGARFQAQLDDGSKVALRIDGIEQHADKNFKDVYAYEVSYNTQDAWLPLCGLDADGLPVKAIPLEGRWDLSEGTATGGRHIDDPSSFTFACVDAVLGKCVMGGYVPWRQVLRCEKSGHGKGKGQGSCVMHSLAAEHQACTRLLRADYCGDGRSHTQDGVLLNMFDAYGVRVDSEQWPFEGEWDENGARCLATTRSAQNVPACYAQLADPQCGMTPAYAAGTLLVSELPPVAPQP